jgi:protocatechuate 3,4-dioxygenase beta subunit
MSSLIRYAFVLALSLCWAAFSPAANSQTATAKKPPQASVSGRITLHGKGIAGIAVSVRLNSAPRPAPEIKAATDPDGTYRISGIPPGSYSVSPMAPAYVFSDSGSSRGQGKTLLLSEGEAVQGVDFSIERGGVIAGKVTDADGKPVVEERLTLLPVDPNQQNQQASGVISANGSQTDDRGMYRIYGLPPGSYKISVGRDDNGYYPAGGVGRVAYKRTFYPDVTDPAEAKVVEVTEGSELTNVDITLGQALPGFAVSGRVIDRETGRPMPGLRFGLRRVLNNNYAGINSSAPSNSQGEFRLQNVIPGKYEVLVLPMQGIETRADAVSFEVIDQDVTGLLVKTFSGLTISGTVVIDGKTDNNTYAKLADLRLHVYVRNDGTSSPSFGQSSLISADGSFRLGGLTPGLANFSLSSREGRPPVNFAILRIERDGVAQPPGLVIKAEEGQVTGVKIVLRYGTGSVRGEVEFENGTLPPGARVMVWLKKLGDSESNIRPYPTDLRGHFLIEGVSAGDYELHVQANVPERRLATAKQSITVADGDVTDVVISLDLKPSPGPAPAP